MSLSNSTHQPQLLDNYVTKKKVQSTPDNSNLQVEIEKFSSYRELELSRVKFSIARKWPEGKRKLLRVSASRFELSGVDYNRIKS